MKNEHEHTPGPWEVMEGDNWLAVTPPNRREALICDVLERGERGYLAEDHANARLIAAAPELLAALQGILRITDRNHVAWEAARNAIAKATGALSGSPNGCKLSGAYCGVCASLAEPALPAVGVRSSAGLGAVG